MGRIGTSGRPVSGIVLGMGLFGATLLSVVTAAAHDGKTRAKAPARQVSAEEQTAYEAAKPAFERHCFRCHSRSSKKPKAKAIKHIDMSSYPFAGHHPHDAGLVIRRSLLGDKAKGKEPTMPPDDPGSVKGEDLEKILAWSEAFEKAHAAKPKTPNRKGAPAKAP